jgi:FAD/FMN-containing dehydrogenase
MTLSLADRAREIVGDANVITDPAALTPLAVDGVRPALAAQPASSEEAAALLTAAAERGAGVLPRGAGVHQHLGGIPARADVVVETTRLAGVTDYVPADYVVVVRAGTRLRDLQAELGQHQQWLPIDPPGAQAATIGGLIAANRNGPRRLLYGSIRDMLIGIRVALPTGEVIKAGGKVVKNVAGYDLTKLFIGSLGAVGVIVEATFKISPSAGEGQTVLVTVPDLAAAHALTTAVMQSYLLPAALEAASPHALGRVTRAAGIGVPDAGAWGVLMLVEGMAESRVRHVAEMRTLVGTRGRMEVLDGPVHAALWRSANFRLRAVRTESFAVPAGRSGAGPRWPGRSRPPGRRPGRWRSSRTQGWVSCTRPARRRMGPQWSHPSAPPRPRPAATPWSRRHRRR